MYSEWASLSSVIAENSCGQSKSVLDKFANGRDVAIAVVRTFPFDCLYLQTDMTQMLDYASTLFLNEPSTDL